MKGDGQEYPYHLETLTFANAGAEELFAFLDDHGRLASHMSKRSWRMGGGKMRIDTDSGKGQVLGSHITLSGTVLGLRLFVDEVVTERTPPQRKVWTVVGTPRLLIMGAYAMGFQIGPEEKSSSLRVFIDYALPENRLPVRLRRSLAAWYARWCIERMAGDAEKRFRSLARPS